MQSIIDRIKNNQFWKFHGGIHPPEQKFLTNTKPIKSLPLPKQLIIPVQQHIGTTDKLLVNVGDYVLKGQPLTAAELPMSVPIHAPTSGHVTEIKPSTIAHPSAMAETCVFLTPDGQEKWVDRQPIEDFYSLSREEIISKIAKAGIAGMGGAGFPSHIKLNTKPVINYLIINAAECEPYITCDDLLMREQSATIANGINILDHLLLPEFILVGIEDNKPEAIAALKASTQHNSKVHICALPTKYPTGGEKQLIEVLTGKQVPHGALPLKLGIIMQNVATVFAIAEAVIHDIPLIKRAVTVTGQGIAKPQNVWSLIGSPIQHLLTQNGYQPDEQSRVIMGGPMMGFTLPNLMVPVVKTTNCILVPSLKEIPLPQQEMECIRCGQCADACPANLLPQELQWHAKAKNHQQLTKLNLADCIECGACAYVCPSYIPLVQYYRVAKAEIRQIQAQEVKAEKAKLRFESRKNRLEKERIARENKHKEAAEARKAKLAASPEAAGNAKSAIEAALARVKARKNNEEAPSVHADVNQTPLGDNVKATANAAIERIKAKKRQEKLQAEAQSSEADNVTNTSPSTEASEIKLTDDNKADAKARAIAKAKERAQAKKESANVDNASDVKNEVITNASAEIKAESDPVEVNDTKIDNKAAAKARAIAKAKERALAKKEATENSTEALSASTSNKEESKQNQQLAPSTDLDDKKAKIAKAISKAKNKTNGNDKKESTGKSDDVLITEKQLKQEKINAVIAEQIQRDNEKPMLADDAKSEAAAAKKAKIAAAIAKAKAKKLKDSENE